MLKKPIAFTDIIQDPYGQPMFHNDHFTVTNKVTVFAGPNGYGKSTLTKMLKRCLKLQDIEESEKTARERGISRAFSVIGNKEENTSKNITFISYDAHADSYQNATASNLLSENHQMFSIRIESSEGQNKLYSLMEVFDAAKEVVMENKELEQIILFVDGIDSGLSIDMINLIMSTLDLKLGQIEQYGVEVALILTTNNYEMCRERTVYDPITFESVTYTNYEEFRKDMLAKSTLNN